MSHRLSYLYFVLCAASLTFGDAGTPSQHIQIGTVKQVEDTDTACGEAFFSSPTKAKGNFCVFTSGEHGGFGYLMVNGKRRRVNFISHRDLSPNKASGSIGSLSEDTYSDGDIVVRFKYKVTALRLDESDFQGIMIVQLGDQVTRLKVWGGTYC